jgi:hypothetical protein
MQKQLSVQCECSPKLFAFFKGTAGEFIKLGPLAPTIMAMAAQMRNSISPFRSKPCDACEAQGYINVSNGPDDFDKMPCGACDGKGYIIS